jgi:transcription elongation factor GreB
MNKAFTKETDGGNEDDFEEPNPLPADVKNYMTPYGYKVLQDEMQQLLRVERPKVVEVVSWAAGNGDRSENGDYIYGKKRLREIDKRVRYISKRLRSAEVVNPEQQQGLAKVFFGATVTYAGADDKAHTVKLVGVDEANVAEGKISWISPMAKALMKSEAGDSVELRTPSGIETIDVLEVRYVMEQA